MSMATPPSQAALVICPYYLNETGQSITCEGLIGDTRTMVRFESAAQKDLYHQQHCQTYAYAEVCPLAEALERKYKAELEEDG